MPEDLLPFAVRIQENSAEGRRRSDEHEDLTFIVPAPGKADRLGIIFLKLAITEDDCHSLI